MVFKALQTTWILLCKQKTHKPNIETETNFIYLSEYAKENKIYLSTRTAIKTNQTTSTLVGISNSLAY